MCPGLDVFMDWMSSWWLENKERFEAIGIAFNIIFVLSFPDHVVWPKSLKSANVKWQSHLDSQSGVSQN